MSTVEPTVEKAVAKASRPRSQVAFPYYNLDSAIEVATKIHREAGGSCSREQLAPILGYSGTKNGGFLSRLGAARMFGLVEEVSGMLRPTDLAEKIYAPVHKTDAERAKVQAFLNVELFEKVYERFKGQPLPSHQGLENLLRVDLKVVPAQIKNALRTLHESAESAGFFNAAGRGRLVMPLIANSEPPAASSSSPTAESVDVDCPTSSTLLPMPAPQQPSVLSQEANIPPAIFGLIRDLPPVGTTMSQAKRQRLINAFEASINWLYPDVEEANDD